MRILQILPELNVGGVETGTVDFAQYLSEQSFYNVVVSNGGALVTELQRLNVKHYTLPVHKKSLWAILKCIKLLREIIIKENIDIVHARSRIPAWIAFFACQKTNAQFITTCHGYYSKNIISHVMGWGKLVIVPSEVIGRHMIESFVVNPENIRCVPRGVNLQKFNINKEPTQGKSNFIISIIGRITPGKGHGYFLKAMAKVVRSIPNLRVWIIGDAPAKKEFYRQELEVLIERLGLKDSVEFLGNRNDVPKLLTQTDVVVFSSIIPESFGRVILEAQAVGVPVVATRVGGVLEIIDHEKTGMLVMPKDSDDMARAIVRILHDPKWAQELVNEARKKINEKFTVQHMAHQTVEVYKEALSASKILVIKLSSIGDVVLITASLKAMRQKFPTAKIYCLVGKESLKILHRCPHIDGLIIYDAKEKHKGLKGILKIVYKLQKYKFDKIIDFQNNRKSHFLSFLSFPKESYGYDNGKWSFLLSHRIKDIKRDIPPVEHQFKILEKLGIEYKSDLYLELWPSKQDKEYINQLLDSEWLGNCNKLVGINMAASFKWKTKNWPVEHIAKLCDILAAQNIRVFITGIEKDQGLAQELIKKTKTKPANFIGKTNILQLAALLKRCQVFITPDSAPMHVAAAMHTPFIAFFGPTDSLRHLPPAKDFFVLEKKLNCAPCYSSRCRILTHACMREITPEEVAEKVFKLMSLN